MSRRVSSLVVLTGFLTLAVAVLLAQRPRNPMAERIQALKLDVVAGDVPVYYSKGIPRDGMVSLAHRLDACRALYPEAGRPVFMVAVLNPGYFWNEPGNLMPHTIGVPGADPPFVILMPSSFREVSARVAGVRDLIAKTVGEANVDRFVRLLAVHELGHIIAAGIWDSARASALGPKDARPQTEQPRTAGQTPRQFPLWYNEFIANYFAAHCNASLQPDDAALIRRHDAAAPVPGQKYATLDDWTRLMADGRGTDQRYFATPEGLRNYAAYEALTGEIANRLRDAGFTAPRMIQLFRQQVVRPRPQSTDDLVKDLAGAAPGLYEWLVQAGAVQPPGKR